MTNESAIISNTGTAFRHLPPEAQNVQIDETARRLVNNEVCYCVSSLVAVLAAREWDGSDGVDPDDLYRLAYREPDDGDYRDAAGDDVGIVKVADGYHVIASEDDGGSILYSDKLDAWRAAFDLAGQDYPDGSEVFEHWLVTDWLADKLAAQGEAVARDVAGLTIWGRATTGQAIYADAVFQRIARDVLEA